MQRNGALAYVFFLLPVLAEAPEEDLKSLQGKWQVVVAKTGLPAQEREIAESMVFEFAKNKLQRYEKGVRQADVLTFVLDPSKNPKEIDLFPNNGGKKPIPLLGIYWTDGDTLKLSWSKSDGRFRPQSFDLAPGKNRTRQVSLILRRSTEK